MIDYDKWDEYYDGGFASDEPTDRFWEEYDSTLEYNRFEYGGQKINVTVKQIMQDMRVKAISDKFLYSDGTVVILLDYSKGIFDKWKNGAVLYCNGEKTYTREQDMTELSMIDRMLFNADSVDKNRVYVFWKEGHKNYRFINGVFVLGKKPYQVEEEGKYRWVFPLTLITDYIFCMPAKYSFSVDVRSVKKSKIRDTNKEEGIRLVDFNETADFSKKTINYKRIPQKKMFVVACRKKLKEVEKLQKMH